MNLNMITAALRSFSARTPMLNDHFNSVIIAAAGSGLRMECAASKQMLQLGGIPIVVRTLQQFQACPFIREIIVAARADELSAYHQFRSVYGLTKISAVVPGGATRQKSVLAALAAVSPQSEYLAIHDAARCLVTPKMIHQVFYEAYLFQAAVAAARPHDTIKTEGQERCIAETIDRNKLWAAQTPQVFRTDLYRAAAYHADQEGFEATDDCMLAEHAGFAIRLVDCGQENLKITTPIDLCFAQAVLTMRAEAEEREAHTQAMYGSQAETQTMAACEDALQAAKWAEFGATQNGANLARNAVKRAKKAAKEAGEAAKNASAAANRAARIVQNTSGKA